MSSFDWLRSKGVIGGAGLIVIGIVALIGNLADGTMPIEAMGLISGGLGILGIRLRMGRPGTPTE